MAWSSWHINHYREAHLTTSSSPRPGLVTAWWLGPKGSVASLPEHNLHISPDPASPLLYLWIKTSHRLSLYSGGGDTSTSLWKGGEASLGATVLCYAVLSCPVMSSSLRPCGLEPTGFLCSGGLSRQEYWSVLPCPPPEDLPSSGSNPGLPHCRWILHHLSTREAHGQLSPQILDKIPHKSGPFACWALRGLFLPSHHLVNSSLFFGSQLRSPPSMEAFLEFDSSIHRPG